MQSCHVVLLRGINVGGHNKLRMKELVALLEELGYTGVRNYIQSGNLVLGANAREAKRLSDRISAAIEERFGLEIPVVTRSAKAFRTAVRSNPFANEGADPALLSTGFLLAKPTAARVAQLDPERSPGDEFRVVSDTIYLRCPNGLARTKLTNAWFDRALGSISTFRNQKTLQKLEAMIDEFEG